MRPVVLRRGTAGGVVCGAVISRLTPRRNEFLGHVFAGGVQGRAVMQEMCPFGVRDFQGVGGTATGTVGSAGTATGTEAMGSVGVVGVELVTG